MHVQHFQSSDRLRVSNFKMSSNKQTKTWRIISKMNDWTSFEHVIKNGLNERNKRKIQDVKPEIILGNPWTIKTIAQGPRFEVLLKIIENIFWQNIFLHFTFIWNCFSKTSLIWRTSPKTKLDQEQYLALPLLNYFIKN